MARSLEELLSVNTVPYEGIVFSPLEYKPITPDLNILQHSLGQIEERAEKAATHKAALNKALGEARLKVHQDEESLKWFDKFADNLTQGVESASERGDLGAAIQEAQLAAGDLTNSPAFLGRMQTNLQYQEQQKINKEKVNKGINTPDEYDYWEYTNPYYNNDIYDDNGKIVGVEEWKEQNALVPHLNTYDVYAKMVSYLPTNKKGGASAPEVVQVGEKTLLKEGSYNTETLTVPEITSAIGKAVVDDPMLKQQMLQNYNVAENYIRTHKDSIKPEEIAKTNEYKRAITFNGQLVTREQYLAKMIERYAEDFAINNDISNINYSGGGNGGGNTEVKVIFDKDGDVVVSGSADPEEAPQNKRTNA